MNVLWKAYCWGARIFLQLADFLSWLAWGGDAPWKTIPPAPPRETVSPAVGRARVVPTITDEAVRIPAYVGPPAWFYWGAEAVVNLQRQKAKARRVVVDELGEWRTSTPRLGAPIFASLADRLPKLPEGILT
jgi:hypothetical protein